MRSRFVESGVRALAAASYVPARIGGCPVRQRVTQAMRWTLTP